MAYEEQLGLVERLSPTAAAIRLAIPPDRPTLTKAQKTTITTMYDTFGMKEFSIDMAVATLDYSEAYTYACIHKLVMLKVLDTKDDDERLFQLLVNPQDNPECFIAAA